MFRVADAVILLPEPSLLPAAEPQAPECRPGFGNAVLDGLLPGGGLPPGVVVELRANGAAAGATTLGLRACRAVHAHQRETRCAFLDPSGTLFAPAVARLGVDLERLIVVRPRWSEVESVAALVADARVAALLVLDLQGAPPPALSSANDAGLITRLSLAVEGTNTSVLLLTRSVRLDESLSPGVGLRLTATRVSEHALKVVVQGRPLRGGLTRVVPWAQIAELHERRAPGAAASG